jgi:hypothetical protein
MEKIHIKEQQPLSLKSEQQREPTEETQSQKTKEDFTDQMNTKETRQEKQDTPSQFEVAPLLEPIPEASIESPPLEPLVIQNKLPDAKDVIDRYRLGDRWKEDFKWPLVSRKVELVRAAMLDPRADVRRKMQIWEKALESDLAEIIQERIGEEMEELTVRPTELNGTP